MRFPLAADSEDSEGLPANVIVMTPHVALAAKSSMAEIRARFEGEVERFSNLETGQTATMDAALAMDLITRAAIAASSPIMRVLDVGCGAGNNALALRRLVPTDFAVDLVDLSPAMLARATERLQAVNAGVVRAYCEDFRDADLPEGSYDVILAAAVLHHLRDDGDWLAAFQKLFALTAPGGSVWITDLVSQESAAADGLMRERYAAYLTALGGADYAASVFAYIAQEDSPRPVTYQLELLRRVGYQQVDLLHKNGCFAAFGAIRSG